MCYSPVIPRFAPYLEFSQITWYTILTTTTGVYLWFTLQEELASVSHHQKKKKKKLYHTQTKKLTKWYIVYSTS